MSNRMRRWAMLLLTMCLMMGGQQLFMPGYCESKPASWDEASPELRAVILNSLKCALSDPRLEYPDAFMDQLNANGIGGLIQNYLQMDLTQLSDVTETIQSGLTAAILNGEIGSGGPPYVSIINQGGSLSVTEAQQNDVPANANNGQSNDVASPNTAPVTDTDAAAGSGEGANGAGNGSGQENNGQGGNDNAAAGTGEGDSGSGNGSGQENKGKDSSKQEKKDDAVVVVEGKQVVIPDTDPLRSAQDAAMFLGNGANAGHAQVLFTKDIKAATTPVTLSFTASGTASPQTLIVYHYVNDAWKLEGSDNPHTITITVNML